MKLKTNLPPRKCEVCGKEFVPKTTTSCYCSRACTQAAYKKRKKQEAEEAEFQEKLKLIPQDKEFLSVQEATISYNVNERTLYRLLKKGTIPSINLGTRLLRIKRSDMEKCFSKRTSPNAEAPKAKKLYSLEPEDCYTIGEIELKFNISNHTVYDIIRRNSIPTRQIGKFVYAPKEDVDEIFK